MRVPITEDEFAAMFTQFRHSAFRLETRDHYAPGYEVPDYERFLAGHPAPPPEVSWWREWLEMITRLTAQGKEVARVRVLAEPPSDYQRWELWAAPWHAAAGERIGYLARSHAAEVGLPVNGDWWVFDDERLVLMGFDGEGRVTGKELVTDSLTVEHYLARRDLAVRYATPAEGIAAA